VREGSFRERFGKGGGSAGDAESSVDIFQVFANGVLGNMKLASDLRVAETGVD
jgi:hypothetical protein